MPGIVRKLLICATAQGLLLQPASSRTQSSPPVLISYGDCAISSSTAPHESPSETEGLESHGLIGILKLSSGTYAISISQRRQVAQIRGKPIYVITDVSFLPLSSQNDAQKSILEATKVAGAGKRDIDSDTDTEDEDDYRASIDGSDRGHETLPPTPAEVPGSSDPMTESGLLTRSTTTVAEDVIKDRGKYGRFAERWFSKAGWTASGREKLGMSRSEDDLAREQRKQGLASMDADAAAENRPGSMQDGSAQDEQGGPPKTDDAAAGIVKSLTPRILQSLRILLSSESFYFSYDYDLSRRTGTQGPDSSRIPLNKRYDTLYFWNNHLSSPLAEANQHAFIVPIIQGFVGQRAFTVAKTAKNESDKIIDAIDNSGEVIEMLDQVNAKADGSATDASAETGPSTSAAESHDYLLTLISRRSVKRAGLRYLRRGVDDQGYVANNVETEQILCDQVWDDSSKVFSLTQVRGSIPLFFSQSPYSFKPTPITYGSEATNHLAFNKHFRDLASRYGGIHIASLVDKHATEKPIGELYEKHVDMTNEGLHPSHGFPGPSSAPARSTSPNPRQLAFTWFDFHHECRAFSFQNVSYLLDCLSPSLTKFHWTELSPSSVMLQSGIIRTNCMDCLDRTNVVQSAIAGSVLASQLQTAGYDIDLLSDPRTQWFNTLWADNGDAISRQYAGTAALKGDFTRTRRRGWTGAVTDFSLTLGRYYHNIFSDYFLQTTIDFVLGNDTESVWEVFESDMVGGDHALDMSRVRHGAVERCVRTVLAEDEEEDLLSGFSLLSPADGIKPPVEEVVLLLTRAALYIVRFDFATEKVGAYERVALEDVQGVKRGTYITSTLGARNLDEGRNQGFVVRYRSAQGVRRVNTRSLDAGEQSDSDAVVEERVLGFKAVAGEERRIGDVAEEVWRAVREVKGEDLAGIEEGDVIGVDEARRATGYLESLGYSLRRLVWA